MGNDSFAIPTIKGRIAERLQRASERIAEGEAELEFEDQPGRVVLDSAEERGVVALACLILENLREQGGTRAPKRPLETVVRKTLETFDRKEVMELEVEAYEILLWIASAVDPEWEREEVEEVESLDPAESKSEMIRWAIADNNDLRMDYYTLGRGELTQRRVTPISLEAEKYLHGYCHMRRDERVFRTSRIAQLRPADREGPTHPVEDVDEAEASSEASEESEPSAQMSLLD